MEGADIGGLGDVTKMINGSEKTFHSAFETTGGAQTITGLPNGTYRLYEAYVPAGYVGTLNYIEFKVAGNVVQLVTEDDSLSLVPAQGDGLALLQIANEPGVPLPVTGGPGTVLLTIVGLVLVAAAGLALLFRKWDAFPV